MPFERVKHALWKSQACPLEEASVPFERVKHALWKRQACPLEEASSSHSKQAQSRKRLIIQRCLFDKLNKIEYIVKLSISWSTTGRNFMHI